MASTTTGLTSFMSTFYDKVFLERAKAELRHDFGASVKSIGMNMGKTIFFNRMTPLSLATTALTEAVNPTSSDVATTLVSAVIADYGNYSTVGSLFKMTSIDEDLKEHVELHGQNAGETIDALIRNELSANATAQIVAGAAVSNISAIHTSDVMTGLEIRKAVRTLKLNKAQRFPGGMFRGIIYPQIAMDLFGNSEWLDAHRYTTSDAIERGVVGKLHGVEFVESNQISVYLSGGFSAAVNDVANVYNTYIFGKGAYGIVNLGSFTSPRIFVKNPGASSTDNPLDQFSTVGWKQPFAVKMLNSSWCIKIQTGATNGNSSAI